MADFNVDLSPKNQPTSLADLLKLQMYSYQGDIAQQQAAQAKQAGIEREAFQGFMKDKSNYLNDQGDIDIDKVNSVLPVIAPLTGHEYAAKLSTLAKNNTEAKDAKLNFDNKERSVVAAVYSSLGYAGIQKPEIYQAALNNLKEQFPNSKNIHRYADAAISNLNMANKDGKDLPKIALQTANQLLSLEQQNQMFAPKAAVNTIGGQTVGVVTQPSVAGSQPTVEATPLGGGGSGTPTPAPAQTKTSSKLPKILAEDTSLTHVPTSSGIVNLNDFQKNAYATGDKTIANANASLQAQKDLQQNVRKVEELLQASSGTKLGQKFTQGLGWVFENPKLDELVKNLAQVQARNAAVMGLDKTDSSRELNAKLSGSEKISPEALQSVMQQIKAESKAAEMFTTGLNKFVEKRGDINGKIQASRFESKWKEHYDPRIFQVDDIALSKMPDADKQRRIDEITSKMTNKEFDKYKKDREIIHRLAKGAYQ